MLEITASSSCRDRHARSRWSSFGVKLQRRRLPVNGASASDPAWGEAGRPGIDYTSQSLALRNRRRKSLRKKLLLLCIGTANPKSDKISNKNFSIALAFEPEPHQTWQDLTAFPVKWQNSRENRYGSERRF
jgi:hypothetical protein